MANRWKVINEVGDDEYMKSDKWSRGWRIDERW